MLARLLGVRIFDIEASSRCNVHCRFCPRDKLPGTGFMSGDTFTRFLDQVPLNGTDSVAFVGLGEPTLNPLLPDFIRETRKRHPKAVTWVTTNGTTLEKGLLTRLVDSGLDILDVSFNGLDRESYERHMRGARYEKTLANVERAAAYLGTNGCRTRLQINYVVNGSAGGREQAIRAFCQERGIAQFRRQPLHDRAGEVGGQGTEDKGQRSDVRDQKLEVGGERGLGGRACEVFQVMTFITWEGDILCCSHDVARRHRIGNLHKHSWGEIERQKRRILRGEDWPAMCARCTDPLRFGMRRDINRKIREEASRRFRGALASVKNNILRGERTRGEIPTPAGPRCPPTPQPLDAAIPVCAEAAVGERLRSRPKR